MDLLQKTLPESVSSRHIPTLLDNIGIQLAKLGASIGTELPSFKMSERVSGRGYVTLTPSLEMRQMVDQIGFETYSKAVQLAMLQLDWGIVREISPEDYSVRLFSPILPVHRRKE